MTEPMKECPFCCSQIPQRAKKCKHCGETVDVALRAAEEAQRGKNDGADTLVARNIVSVGQLAIAALGFLFGIYFLIAGLDSLLSRGEVVVALMLFCLSALAYYIGDDAYTKATGGDLP